MWGHYHIFSSLWPAKLGVHYYQLTKPHLSKLLKAHSKEDFDSRLLTIHAALVARPDPVEYMEDWAKDQHHYATYLLDSYARSLGRQGSTPSEQNHSSCVAIICTGMMDDPCIILQKARLRQNKINCKRNKRIARYVCKSARERHLALVAGNNVTAAVLQKLSSWGFEIWEKQYAEAQKYEATQSAVTGDNISSGLIPMSPKVFCAGRKM